MIRVLTLAAIITIFLSSRIMAEVPGGSNYGWYRLENCRRDPFNVVSHFKAGANDIKTQLSEMYAGGQRRLRLPLYFFHSAPPEHVSSSQAGLSQETTADLRGLLELVRATGCEEIIFGFFPLSLNWAWWTNWNEEIYQENWLVVRQARDLVAESGLHYRIDLLNEGMPHRSQKQLFTYVKRLWADYTDLYGTSDTLGFSVIPEAGRLENVREVYGDKIPSAFDIHVYESPEENIVRAKSVLDRLGLGDVPWIIGETFYNNSRELERIRAQAKKSGVTILFMTQWPLSSSATCRDVDSVPVGSPATLGAPPD